MILKNKDNTEMMVTCYCGCDQGLRFRILPDDDEFYSVITYYSGDWYREQEMGCWKVFCSKIKKIWAIIRNKDFYYNEILLGHDESREFKKYVNEVIRDKEK